MKIKYCDIFSGLGGFSVAIHSVFPDAECIFASEIDEKAKETFNLNFGIMPQGDITKIDISLIPDHDILFGGFPCQPFSRNGQHYNKNNKTIENDDRANLFLNLVDILVKKQPKYFIFENVKGLIEMKNLDGSLYFETILNNLKLCNYNIHTKILNANGFGVPQQRERIFFVGTRSDIPDVFVFPDPINNILSIFDILESDVDDRYLLKNLWKNRKVTRNPSAIKQANHSLFAGEPRINALKEIMDNNTKIPNKNTGKISSIAVLYGETPSGLPRQQDKIYSPYGISPTIATFSTPCIGINSDLNKWRQLTPRECARLQGIPDAFILPASNSVAYKQIGNAICVNVVVAILNNLIKESL